MAGEGLSSWTARLAAHNFVALADFWTWIGALSAEDIAPSPSSVARFSAVTGMAEAQILALGGRVPAGGRAWIATPARNGCRGAACTVCCREAAEQGQDHWWAQKTQALMRVSCPIHRCGLADLDNLEFVLAGGRLHLGRDDGARLGVGRGLPLDPLLLSFEAAILAAQPGRPLDKRWRVRSARDLRRATAILIDYVLYREGVTTPFAQLFDTQRNNGGHMAALLPEEPPKGLARLKGLSMRTRRNVLSAVAALLSRPETLHGDYAEALGWRTSPDARGPFWALVQNIGVEPRRHLAASLGRLPTEVAAPVRAALDLAAFELA
jgi:hypothetical protein